MPFPSPCGEKVGINDKIIKGQWRTLKLFPSPCGEKVGINDMWRNPQLPGVDSVSVPLRGKGRDQLL